MSPLTELFESDVAAVVCADGDELQRLLAELRGEYPGLSVEDYRRHEAGIPKVFEAAGPTVVLLAAEQKDLGRAVQRTEASASGAEVFCRWLALATPSFVVPEELHWVRAAHLEETKA